MAEIRPSSFEELRSLAGALFVEHWQEVALNKSLMVLRPDEGKYRAMEAAGMLLALAAWEEVVERKWNEPAATLVGYSLSCVTTHLHYADLVYAQNDVLFVRESHRKSRIGKDLVIATECAAKARGARLMLWHAKQGTALDQALPRWGYGVQDVIYSKEL